jgi:hypothetical protein
MKALLVVALTISITGCVNMTETARTPQASAKPVPAERILAFQENNPGTARVIVTRDTGILAAVCYFGVQVGDTVIGRFDRGETAQFFVPAGQTSMAAVADPLGNGTCSSSLQLSPVFEKHFLKAGDVYNFRINLGKYRPPMLLRE